MPIDKATLKEKKKKLDELYQDSITTLEPYWESSRESGDETHVVDQIVSHYDDELKKIDLTEEEILEFLTEWVFNGIT